MSSPTLVKPRYREKFAQRKPTVVYMFLPQTEPACNSRCIGCYVLASESYKRRAGRTEESIIVDILRLRKSGFSVLESTTEILMFRRWAEILRCTDSKSLLTNGRILAEKPDLFWDIKNAGIVQITLTANFVNSGITLTEPRFFTDAARIVKDAGMELMLRITLTKQNLPAISEMVAACVALGADIIQFLRFMPLERGGCKQPQTIDEKDAKLFFGRLEKLRAFYPNVYLSAGGSLGSQFRKKEKQIQCPAGKAWFVIGLDNGIYPCIYLTQRENRLGKFVDGELKFEREFSLTAAGASGVGDGVNPLDCPAYAYLKEKQNLR